MSNPKVLMGVGNVIGGDDAVGIYIVRNFKKEGWIGIDCGPVPEDFTGDIKKIKPEIIVIVDAADMGLEPGEIRIIPKERIPNVALSTHGMPLVFLMDYLKDYTNKIILIGIQVKNTEFGSEMSPEIKKAGDKLLDILKSGNLEKLEIL